MTEPGDPAEVPHLFVVQPPAGWNSATTLPPAGRWGFVMTGDGCALSSRGAVVDDVADDDRGASIAVLTGLAQERGQGAPQPSDVSFITDAGVDPSNPAATLEFVTDGWSTSGTTVTAAARTITQTRFDGSSTSSHLEVTLECDSSSAHDAAWSAVLTGVRPIMLAVESEPWQWAS